MNSTGRSLSALSVFPNGIPQLSLPCRALTLLNVLVELVDEGVQLLSLQHGEIQRVAGVHPLAQGAVGKQKNTTTAPQRCRGTVGPHMGGSKG